MYFQDVKIPATNCFSKCEHCERLKKMINTGDIEAGHNLSIEEYEQLQYDNKVFYKYMFVVRYMCIEYFGILTTYFKLRIGEV
jgi:hypothetical protein